MGHLRWALVLREGVLACRCALESSRFAQRFLRRPHPQPYVRPVERHDTQQPAASMCGNLGRATPCTAGSSHTGAMLLHVQSSQLSMPSTQRHSELCTSHRH